MSILGLYSHMWWDAPDVDDFDQDDAVLMPELLLNGWWSAASELDDDDA